MFLASAVTLFAGFLYSMYTTRYLGTEQYGVLSFSLAFTSIFLVFMDFGLGQRTVREVARNRSLANKYFGNILMAKFFLVACTFAATVIVVHLFGYPDSTIEIIYIMTMYTIAYSFNGTYVAFFQAFERMEYPAIGTIINNALMLIGALIVIQLHLNAIAFALLYLFSALVVLAFSIVMTYYQGLRPKAELDLAFLRPAFKEALPFGTTSLLIMLYTYLDSVMLSMIKGYEAVGIYNAANRLVLTLLFIPNILNLIVFPIMSKFYVSSHGFLMLVYRKYFKIMLILSFPLCFGVTLLADRIILTIFGTGFTDSIPVLQILIWLLLFAFCGASFAKLLESVNKQAVITKASTICLIIIVVLNLSLIPRFSYLGTSIANVAAQFVLFIIEFLAVYRLGYGIPLKSLSTDAAKVLCACLLMALFIKWMHDLNLVVLIACSAAVYFVVVYLLGVLDDEDTRLIKQILKPRISKGVKK